MSGFTPWRGSRGPAQASPSAPLHPEIAAKIQLLHNEKAALTQQLRDTARERARLADEVASARLIIAGIAHECEANCMHAKANRELVHTLHQPERVIAELQAVNEAHDSSKWAPRAEPVATVPGQRRGRQS